jgi:protein-disulfide isomerase/uncharacterized membrane protein
MQKPAALPAVRGWRIAFLVVCTIGICLSADLLRLHVNVHTDPDYQSYCAMSERVNCNTVALSGYAVVLGLPLAIWGILAYLAMAVLAVWGLRERPRTPAWPFGLLVWLSLFATLTGIILLGISHFVIESMCIVCTGSYVVNFALLATSYEAVRRIGLTPLAALRDDMRSISAGPWPVATLAGTLALAAALLWATVPPYWRVEASTSPRGILVGETSDGHPWIGADRPTLEIIEYSDYQCPHCRRGHIAVRNLVEAYPDQVRLVHRNYPLDHQCNEIVANPFHEHACEYARMAVCARQKGRFWEVNDYLFARGYNRAPVSTRDLAVEIGLDAEAMAACVSGPAARLAVQEDLAAGRALGIRGTPTYVIGETVYPGRIPPDVIAAALSGQPDTGRPSRLRGENPR